MTESTLVGSVLAEGESQLRLSNVTQTVNDSGNFVGATSRLDVFGEPAAPSTLVGLILVDGFSNGQFQGEVSLGDLVCTPGSDASCSGGVTRASSSCGICP